MAEKRWINKVSQDSLCCLVNVVVLPWSLCAPFASALFRSILSYYRAHGHTQVHSGTSALCVFSGSDNFSSPNSSVRRRKEDWNQSLSDGADVFIHYLQQNGSHFPSVALLFWRHRSVGVDLNNSGRDYWRFLVREIGRRVRVDASEKTHACHCRGIQRRWIREWASTGESHRSQYLLFVTVSCRAYPRKWQLSQCWTELDDRAWCF